MRYINTITITITMRRLYFAMTSRDVTLTICGHLGKLTSLKTVSTNKLSEIHISQPTPLVSPSFPFFSLDQNLLKMVVFFFCRSKNMKFHSKQHQSDNQSLCFSNRILQYFCLTLINVDTLYVFAC